MNNNDSTGEPAFPCDWIDRDSMGNQVIREQHYGMTLRDYFAAKAMAATISKDHNNNYPWGGAGAKIAAEEAYLVADAMLKAREGKL